MNMDPLALAELIERRREALLATWPDRILSPSDSRYRRQPKELVWSWLDDALEAVRASMEDRIEQPLRAHAAGIGVSRHRLGFAIDEVVRRGLRALLESEADFEVVGEARNGREAVELAAALAPDLVLMDLMMPEMEGGEAIAKIHGADPELPVVVLSSFVGSDELFPAIRAGAAGYLLKDGEPEDLLRGLREAVLGGTPLAPAAARRLMAEATRSRAPVGQVADPLSEREIEVLKVLTRGLCNRDIADLLCISEATTRSHVSSILRKLGLDSRTQAALYALRTGLVRIEELAPPAD